MTDIDTDGQIEAVARTVTDRPVDGAPATAITLAQTYPTTIDDLWSAVTDADRIARWLGPISGDLREGGTFAIEGNATGTITACDPPHAVDATWEYAGAISWIEVRLTAVGDQQARVELTHLARPDDHWEQFGPAAGGIGWDLGLLGLGLHLGNGERPDDADAWMTSPEGVRFVVESATAWRAAHVRSGADADVAQAAADRTVSAYTQPTDES